MSTLWTPGGERPIPPRGSPSDAPPPASGPSRPAPTGPGPEEPELSPEDRQRLEAQMTELRQQLANTPAEVVVANHCYGLFELAGVYLSLEPPQLDGARLAIDALGAMVEGLGERLGSQQAPLKEGLAQLRLAFVQIHRGQSSPTGDGSPSSR